MSSHAHEPISGEAARDGAPTGAVPELPVDWSTEPPALYATGAHVTFTPREFALLFDETAPFPGRRAAPGAPEVNRSRLVASLRVSPEAYFRMVCAMASNWNRFAVERMPADADRPRFALFEAGDLQLAAVDAPAGR